MPGPLSRFNRAARPWQPLIILGMLGGRLGWQALYAQAIHLPMPLIIMLIMILYVASTCGQPPLRLASPGAPLAPGQSDKSRRSAARSLIHMESTETHKKHKKNKKETSPNRNIASGFRGMKTLPEG